MTDWTSDEMRHVYAAVERVANTQPDGSTERGLLREALDKIDLADTYIEKRLREDEA